MAVTADNTPLLDKIDTISDLRKLDKSLLPQLCAELRADVIGAVSKTGGHLGAGLGVVELTVALHYIFDTPKDRLIWDVGHQAYPHKILTGRRDQMSGLRHEGGISGFTKRSESEFDPFGAGHSSTSISAGLGMAVARDMKGDDNHVIAVIGDGAMSAGMAYEAVNNAGAMENDLIVILNDNDMSIAPPVGALSSYLSELISSRPYHSIRGLVKQVASRFPSEIERTARRARDIAREVVSGHSLFSELGFFYIGPIDGHDLNHLLPVLKNLRDREVDGPVLVHVVTEKGKGHPFAGPSVEKYHAVPKFDLITGEQKKSAGNLPSYTSVFAETLVNCAAEDDKIVAITAAMPSGTGLDKLQARFPARVFDVGIAEQHAVTFAAGLATEGYRPFAAIYSTFLQRGYDQLVHDVAIQNLPGVFDLAYLSCLPNMTIMCPSDEAELARMTVTAAQFDDGPSAVRYPRGTGTGVQIDQPVLPVEIGKARLVHKGSRLCVISLGTMLEQSRQLCDRLEGEGVSTSLADARFAKPFDKDLFIQMAHEHDAMLIVEESSPGGFSAHLLQYLANQGALDNGLMVRVASLPDSYIDHAERNSQLEQAGLDPESLYQICQQMLLGCPVKTSSAKSAQT